MSLESLLSLMHYAKCWGYKDEKKMVAIRFHIHLGHKKEWIWGMWVA